MLRRALGTPRRAQSLLASLAAIATNATPSSCFSFSSAERDPLEQLDSALRGDATSDVLEALSPVARALAAGALPPHEARRARLACQLSVAALAPRLPSLNAPELRDVALALAQCGGGVRGRGGARTGLTPPAGAAATTGPGDDPATAATSAASSVAALVRPAAARVAALVDSGGDGGDRDALGGASLLFLSLLRSGAGPGGSAASASASGTDDASLRAALLRGAMAAEGADMQASRRRSSRETRRARRGRRRDVVSAPPRFRPLPSTSRPRPPPLRT